VTVSSPVLRGKAVALGVGRCRAVHEGMSMMVLMA
jgi:hypothetical protein